MKTRSTWLILGLIPLLASCASQPVALAPVGPRPTAWFRSTSSPGKGLLQVFTETDEYEWSRAVPYYPHRDYEVYTFDGRRLKRVWNSQSHEDETPSVVELPPGQYLVKADAEFCGRVSIPVVIKAQELTRVVLQPGWKPRGTFTESELVRSPAGYFVGWRADLARAN